eukprot:2022547-Rhodomonas_salina.2
MGWGQVTALVPEATLVRTEGSSWSLSAWFGANYAGQKLLELYNVSNNYLSEQSSNVGSTRCLLVLLVQSLTGDTGPTCHRGMV